MPESSSRAVYTSAVLSGPLCAILGLSWSNVMERAGLVAFVGDREDPAFLVSADEFIALWNAMIELTDQADVTRFLGQRMAGGPAIPILFAMSTAPDFKTGLSRFARYKHLFGPMRFATTSTKDSFTLRVLPDRQTTTLPPTLSSAQLVYLQATALAMATRPFFPLGITLPLPGAERHGLKEVFGVTPEKGPPSVRYATQHTRTPFISHNEKLWRATEEDLRSQSLILSGDSPITHRVRATVLEALGTTEPGLSHVCSRLKISKSTLFRRLRAEGTTFQSLLDETRSGLAERYLRASDLSNQQVAHLLGYRDSTAFQRAFRKWTGKTPREFRKQVSPNETGVSE
ncbi:MAG: helix-turn-helix domain-containing protein [Pseudomonadota bacterium]